MTGFHTFVNAGLVTSMPAVIDSLRHYTKRQHKEPKALREHDLGPFSAIAAEPDVSGPSLRNGTELEIPD